MTSTVRLKALLAGHVLEALYAPASILKRASFDVEYICPELGPPDIKECKRIYFQDPFSTCISNLTKKNHYNLVVLGDDQSIAEVLDSNLSTEEKLKILPVQSKNNFDHLYSKCHLAKIFLNADIKSPKFTICTSPNEIFNEINKIGYPVIIKADRSTGGSGTYEFKNRSEISEIINVLRFPILIQEKILGNVIDLSGFYQEGRMIFFTYSSFIKSISKFGASSVREYTQIGKTSKSIYKDLNKIGIALGANGFVNISAIENYSTKELYYFEADMRPNVWVDAGKYVGEDASIPINNYYHLGIIKPYSSSVNQNYPINMVLSYLIRLSLLDLLANRNQAWFKHIDNSEFAKWYLINKINIYASHYFFKFFNILIKVYSGINCMKIKPKFFEFRKVLINNLVYYGKRFKPYIPKIFFNAISSFLKKLLKV